MNDVAQLAILFFAVAILYTAVGHGGASGYLAVMALVGTSQATMKPTALVLNILVASLATIRYARAGAFSWRGTWPFMIGSMPLAFIGGAVHLPSAVYRPVVGAILLLGAFQMVRSVRRKTVELDPNRVDVPVVPAIAAGGGIGLISGLTGTGGGIFLSPLLLFTGWTATRISTGIAATFILGNSVAGLAGNLASIQSLPRALPLWALSAFAGGLVGTELGSRRLGADTLKLLLAAVITVAALKLIFA